MSNPIKQKILKYILLMLVLGLINFPLSTAVWKYGSIHIHTGYSSWEGYDGNIFTIGDNCPKETFNFGGYTVEELKEQALDLGLQWLAFSDHSYCLDSSEFNTVKTDCQNAQNSSFTCLWGEELSVRDNYGSTYDEGLCVTFESSPYQAGHLGAYGISSFISQSPAEKWCPNSPTAQDGIDSINNGEGVSIINHPAISDWDFESIDDVSNYKGIEIWNGEWGDGNNNVAYNIWLNKLQEGENVFAFGGTDIHGQLDINNYNFVEIDSLIHSGLEGGLESGTNVVSNNGYVTIKAKTNTQSSWTDMGDELDAYTNEILTIRVQYDVVDDCELWVIDSEIGSYWEYHYPYDISGSGSFDLEYALSSASAGKYYFRAECISSDGIYRMYTNPIWVNVDVTVYDIPLYEGWNLISIPLILIDNSLPNALSSIEGSYHVVFAYDANDVGDEWKSYDPERPPYLNTLTEFDEKHGYWMKMWEDGTLELEGTIPESTAFNLKQGWNLIGYPSLITTTPVNKSIEDIKDALAKIFQYNASDAGNEWKSYSPDWPDFLNPLKYFAHGYGYWVKVTDDVDCIFNGTHFLLDTKTSGQESIFNSTPPKASEIYGTLTINNELAGDGTLVMAYINDTNVANATTINGYYSLTVGPDGDATNDTIEGGKANDIVIIKVAGDSATEFTWTEGSISQDNISISTNKFRIQNASGSNVAYFDDIGNIVLKGTCSSGGVCTAPADSFIFKDSSGNEVAHIDPNGNLCIETGDCSDNSADCDSPTGDSFLVKDENEVIASYIDENGDLCLTGSLTENGSP